MKLATKILVAVGMAAMLASKPLLAGDGKTFKEKVVVEEERKIWGASLSTGWDSLYMFRGVNVLRFAQDGSEQGYGSSLYWTALSASYMPTENDTFTIGSWMAFGLSNSNYKELNITANYVRTIGDFAVGFGYTFYYYLASELFQNELNATLAYTFNLPANITITPSLTYFFNLGPDFHDFRPRTGAVNTASSFLNARIDSNIPIYQDIIALAPWVAFGTSFDFNPKTTDDGFEFFTGANNLELGLGLPIKINDIITLYGYGAYSYQWANLVGTEPSTFWGGAKVTFSF